MKKIKTLIVDDHRIIRDGIRSMLESYKSKYSFSVEGAASGEEGLVKIKQYHYDIVLMDYRLPKLNGAETTRAMLAHNPDLNILALSNHDETAFIENILEAGAKGYLLKNIDPDELIKAMTAIWKGKNYYCNEVAAKLLSPDKAKLSERQFQILRLIAKENTSEKIADILFLSRRTVDKHRQHLLQKFKVGNTAGLLREARLRKLID